ncbi:MAG TPA: GNAT family N-acetyltransferase [Gaiellaceae bacterium]|jgi:RimJ/RimL family protein N-acetyltransferase
MTVHLESWSEDDLHVLEITLGDPEMMTYLGGIESPDKLAERQARFAAMKNPEAGLMFTVVDDATGEKTGSVGYWEKSWNGDEVYETGWLIARAFQGRGIATEGMRQLIDRLRGSSARRYLHAFPNVDNAPSNAICRKLGFELLAEHEFEYPKGSFMRCNDWRLDLTK